MSLRHILKRFLQRSGLHEASVRARIALDPSRAKYRRIKRHTLNVGGVPVSFSTEDDYSNRWFLPRYEGGRLHERRVTESLIEALQDARVFVDAGANLGWFTCIAASQMTDGQVYAFEMDRMNYGLLRRNVEINASTNVETYHMAVSDTVGEITYARSSERPSAMLTMLGAAAGDNVTHLETVGTTSLDAFFDDRALPDVLKVDVEGAEMGVLKGMTRIIERAHPLLFLEIHPNNLGAFGTSAQEVLAFLTERGYRISAIDDMRNQESTQPLIPITRADQIRGNAMLYATHESRLA